MPNPLPFIAAKKVGIAAAGKAVGVPAIAAFGLPVLAGAAVGGTAVWAYQRHRRGRK